MSFLRGVASHLLSNHADHLGDCIVVFPNRRAGLFLKKELSNQLDQPVWSPSTYSLEDFLFSFSEIKKADPLTLIFELYNCFRTHNGQDEGFESFYFWGEMLLRDFEEVDHYLVDPKQLFSYVKNDRQLQEDFYFLTPEQEEIIKKFWQEFLPTSTKSQEKFVATWKILFEVYQSFKSRLKEEGIGYTSHIYRELFQRVEELHLEKSKRIVFAGFNALTLAEEKLIKHFVVHFNAEVLWDIDDYYISDPNQEAGNFLRRYAEDSVLGPTFTEKSESRISESKTVETIGVALEVGQAKLIGERVGELLAGGTREEEIAIILPQEYMLFPVLNALPESVKKLNVTMGYPLKETPLFALLESVIELQEQASLSTENGISFYHKPSLAILSHPYLFGEEDVPLNQLITGIKKNNQIRVFQKEIQALQSTVLNTIFRQIGDGNGLVAYLQEVCNVVGQFVVERFGLEHEYLYHYQQLLSRLGEVLEVQKAEIDFKTFKSLFGKASRSIKIPFSGEPVSGLQIMGVLETRNLDFKHILMLNMNEGIFPSAQRVGSFIPYRIRKGFDLPTHETLDGIYAYLFYRLFHSSSSLSFYYNMYADFGLSGELSRFVRQIQLESSLKVRERKLSNSIQVSEIQPISIATTKEVLKKLAIYTDQVPEREQRRLSASALNTYLDCKLKFYFRYALRLFSADQMSDDLDARHFGNALHKTLEYLYLDTLKEKKSRIVEESDFFRLEVSVGGAIEKAFREEFGMKDKKRFEFKDRNAVMAEIIKKLVLKVLALDKEYTPFEIVSLEDEDKYERYLPIEVNDKSIRVKLGADIDRVDKKKGTVRVLDYKTGRDETEIGSLDQLLGFGEKTKKKSISKAGNQTFFYAWLYASKYGASDVIVPGLINLKQFLSKDFDYRLQSEGRPISDVRSFLSDFELKLQSLLTEIFDSEVYFDQTDDTDKCKFCDYKGICSR